jgi:hypothetical protein
MSKAEERRLYNAMTLAEKQAFHHAKRVATAARERERGLKRREAERARKEAAGIPVRAKFEFKKKKGPPAKNIAVHEHVFQSFLSSLGFDVFERKVPGVYGLRRVIAIKTQDPLKDLKKIANNIAKARERCPSACKVYISDAELELILKTAAHRHEFDKNSGTLIFPCVLFNAGDLSRHDIVSMP